MRFSAVKSLGGKRVAAVTVALLGDGPGLAESACHLDPRGPATCANGRWLAGRLREMWARWVLPLTASRRRQCQQRAPEALPQLPGESAGREHRCLLMSKALAAGCGVWPSSALPPAPTLPSPQSPPPEHQPLSVPTWDRTCSRSTAASPQFTPPLPVTLPPTRCFPP